tara:strand:- start:57 stop:758 length:702 start_codon:yes stop_codon:yes gene_type:complete
MIESLILISSVALGSIIAYLLKSAKNNSLKILLTFSGAYLLSVGLLHLLPEIYDGHNHRMGLYIMAGFLIQLILEFFSMGVEHGHAHTEHFKNKGIPISIILSLFVHAFMESLPISLHSDHEHSNSFLWAIVVHKLPVSIILFLMLSEVFKSKWKIAIYMLSFALIAPIGVFVGSYFVFLADYYREITALVLGIFLHISTTILFESNQSHSFNIIKFLTTLAAVAIAWLSSAH